MHIFSKNNNELLLCSRHRIKGNGWDMQSPSVYWTTVKKRLVYIFVSSRSYILKAWIKSHSLHLSHTVATVGTQKLLIEIHLNWIKYYQIDSAWFRSLVTLILVACDQEENKIAFKFSIMAFPKLFWSFPYLGSEVKTDIFSSESQKGQFPEQVSLVVFHRVCVNKTTSFKMKFVSMTQCYNRPMGLLRVNVTWLTSDYENTFPKSQSILLTLSL